MLRFERKQNSVKQLSFQKKKTPPTSERSAFAFYPYSLNGLYTNNGTPLQYSCLENPMDGRAWWAAVHGVAKSRTGLKRLSSSSSIYSASFSLTVLETRKSKIRAPADLVFSEGPLLVHRCLFTVFMELRCIERLLWHRTPVLLPGNSHGRRSLVGCSPWGR